MTDCAGDKADKIVKKVKKRTLHEEKESIDEY